MKLVVSGYNAENKHVELEFEVLKRVKLSAYNNERIARRGQLPETEFFVYLSREDAWELERNSYDENGKENMVRFCPYDNTPCGHVCGPLRINLKWLTFEILSDDYKQGDCKPLALSEMRENMYND